jgi:hypothetical protein
MVVTGDHSAVLNAYVEILKASAGSRLVGLLPHRRPHAEQVFEALLTDDGLTKDQAALLNELYVLEGRLEHASPDVDAGEVRDGVERLREALPGLIDGARVWLSRHGARAWMRIRLGTDPVPVPKPHQIAPNPATYGVASGV